VSTQHEVGKRNLEILDNSTDARGRKLEVVKVHCPPPLFRTYKEAEGVHVSTSYQDISPMAACSPQMAVVHTACSVTCMQPCLANAPCEHIT